DHEAARRTSGSGTPLPGVLRTRSDARRGGWRGGPNESPVREISGPQRASEGRSEGPGGQGGGLHLLRAVGSQRTSGGTRIRGIYGLLLPRRAHSGRGGEDREGLPVPPGAVRLPLLGLGSPGNQPPRGHLRRGVRVGPDVREEGTEDQPDQPADL